MVSYWEGLGFRFERDFGKADHTKRLSNHKLLAGMLVLKVRGTRGLPVDFSFILRKRAVQASDLRFSQWCCGR